MTSLTERYVAAALRGIPERQRADVESELRSSIVDAVEDRVAAGEDRAAAETAVLEGLGNPAVLSAEYAGRPLHLIGPELYLVWREVLVRLLVVVVPIVAIVVAGATVLGGAGYLEALADAVGGALSVGVHIAFWTTLAFAVIERVEAMRDARTEIAGATGRWTVGMLPAPASSRVGAGETVSEVLTTLLTMGGLLFARDLSLVTDADGAVVPLFDPALTTFWFPVLIVVLAALAVTHVVIHVVGRWTIPLAVGFTVLEVAFAAPLVGLALGGTLINPAFAAEIGWPPLAEGDGPAMIAIAAGATLVTGWEIVDAFRRARRARGAQGGTPAGAVHAPR